MHRANKLPVWKARLCNWSQWWIKEDGPPRAKRFFFFFTFFRAGKMYFVLFWRWATFFMLMTECGNKLGICPWQQKLYYVTFWRYPAHWEHWRECPQIQMRTDMSKDLSKEAIIAHLGLCHGFKSTYPRVVATDPQGIIKHIWDTKITQKLMKCR